MTICTTAFVIKAGEGPDPTYEMIGAWVAETFTITQSVVNWAYWAHMLAICTFLFLIPLSKHMHLVMALPNVFFFDTQPMAKMRPLQVDENGTAVSLDELDLETFGAASYTQLTWRSLIDGWACTSCARCQDVCPAYASGKALNPMQIIHDVRAYANEHSELIVQGRSA